MEKVKELRKRAEFFYKKKLKAFVIDKNNSYYFCKILAVDDIRILVDNFIGKREGKTDSILLIDVLDIKDYKEKGELNG